MQILYKKKNNNNNNKKKGNFVFESLKSWVQLIKFCVYFSFQIILWKVEEDVDGLYSSFKYNNWLKEEEKKKQQLELMTTEL